MRCSAIRGSTATSRPWRKICRTARKPASAAASAGLLFAVSEGTWGGGSAVTDEQIAAKYKPLTDVMQQALGQPVRVKYVRDFRALDEGMKSGAFDLVMSPTYSQVLFASLYQRGRTTCCMDGGGPGSGLD